MRNKKKIRNSKFEIRNKFKIQMLEIQNKKQKKINIRQEKGING